MFPQFNSPDEPPIGTNVPATELDTDDVIQLLSEGEEEKPDKSEEPEEKPEEKEIELKEDEGDEEEEDSDLKEIEEELEGPTEEQLELVTPVRRKEILTKYPNLFKDFPYLERAYYREQQFTEHFPTIQDAKEASEKAQALDRFEVEVMSGNLSTIMKAMKQESPKGFNKLVDNYLVTLADVDEKAYNHLLGNITKHTIIAMAREGKESDNKVLLSAAQILNQFVFGNSKFTPPTNLSKEDDEGERSESKELETRKQAFIRQQLDSTVSDLNMKVNNTLKNTIDSHIDPKGSMTEYVKKNASREALESLDSLISKDTRFKSLTDRLWKKAIESNFSPATINQIKSAYLSKARTLLPAVIKKARNEALKGSRSSTKSESVDRKGPLPQGRPSSSSKAKELKPEMSTLDYLMQD